MEVIIVILGIALLIWICSGSGNNKTPDTKDLRIGRNIDGKYYIYENGTGDVIGTYPDQETARQHLEEYR